MASCAAASATVLFERALALYRQEFHKPGEAACLRALGRTAIAHADPSAAKLLLQHGADVRQATADCRSALYAAAYNGYFELAELLLQLAGLPYA